MPLRTFSIVLFLVTGLFAEQINRLIATVGPIGVTAIDLQDEIKIIRNSRLRIPKSKSITHFALNSLIEQAIVQYAAEEESIIITDAKIDNAIQKEMEAKGIQNKEDLKRKLKRKLSVTLEDYRENIRQKILRQQVAQQKIKLFPPSDNEIKKFYRTNIQKIGYKYYYRLISIPFKPGDTKDELRANKLIAKAKQVARTNFAKAARMYSRHSSRKNGGLIGWQSLAEIALINPKLPGLVQQSSLRKVSDEYPLGNAYFIVIVEKKRRPQLSELTDTITNLIYSEKQKKKFKNWLVKEKRRLAVKIFLKGYRKQ